MVTMHSAVRTTSKTPEDKLRERLNDPKVAAQLNVLLDRLDLVVFSLVALDGLLRRSNEIIEAVTEGVGELNKTLPEVTLNSTRDGVEHLKDLFTVSVRVKEILSSPEFEALMQSGVLSPETVSVVGKAGDAFTEAAQTPAAPGQKVGVFGLMRALDDPDIQRTLQLGLRFAKIFGSKLHA